MGCVGANLMPVGTNMGSKGTNNQKYVCCANIGLMGPMQSIYGLIWRLQGPVLACR